MTRRATIQFLVLLTGILFESIGKDYGTFSPFPVSDIVDASVRHYVYDICEHFKFIALVLLMWRSPALAADYKTDGLFVVLAILDFGDYLLTGNDVWFGFQYIEGYKAQFPVSMNMVSLVWFFIYAHNQWKMNGSRGLY